MSKPFLHIGLVCLFLLPLSLIAQDDWEKPAGGIKDAQVIIEKDKVISLRPVSRKFRAIQIEIPQAQPITLSYRLKTAVDSLPALQVIVRPRTMKDQPLDKFYGFNARLGYGNYGSPYALVSIGSKRSDAYMVNGNFNHYSSAKGPVLDDFSGAGVTNVGGSGKYFLNNSTIYADANYKYQTYSIYGYDPVELNSPLFDLLPLYQKLNVLSFSIGMNDNNLKNNIDSDLNLAVNYLTNNYQTSEFLFDLNYKFSSKIDNSWSISAEANYTSFLYAGLPENAIGRKRRFAQLKPLVRYKLNKLSVTAGINAFYENDPISMGVNNYRIYPVVGAEYQLADNHLFKVLYDGQVEKISLNRLYEQNPYLDNQVQVNNNVNDISASIGLEGKLLSNFGYTLSYQYKHYDRLLFYNNNDLDSARFTVLYDEGGATINRVSADLNYTINKQISLSTKIASNTYTTVDLPEAWHRPEFELSFTTNFNIIDALNGHITYFLLSGIKAQTVAGEVKTLATVHDLNFGLDLSFTERVGIFVDLMNILGSNYQLYNNYPVKGFQVIGGLSYKF